MPFFDRDQNEIAVEVAESIAADPIVSDFARRLWPLYQSGEGFSPEAYSSMFKPLSHLTRVEDVLGERGFVAMHALSFAQNALEPAGIPEQYREAWVFIAKTLWDGVPYLWKTDMRIAAEACPVPPHILSSSVLPFPTMWWTFETAAQHGDRETSGLLMTSFQGGLLVMPLGREGDRPTFDAASLEYGKRFPDDVQPSQLADMTIALALLSFVNSPHIPKDTRRMSGALRRTLGRSGWTETARDQVAFVDLRSEETWEPEHGLAGKGKNHEFRWLVRGHHRAQWYPSEHAHRVIWIAPFVKGPEGKPLRSPTYRVNR